MDIDCKFPPYPLDTGLCSQTMERAGLESEHNLKIYPSIQDTANEDDHGNYHQFQPLHPDQFSNHKPSSLVHVGINDEKENIYNYEDGPEDIEEEGMPDHSVGEYILLFIILSVPELKCASNFWELVSTGIIVTPSFQEQDRQSLGNIRPKSNVFKQETSELSTLSGGIAREICVHVPLDEIGTTSNLDINNSQFQIFLSTSGDVDSTIMEEENWSYVDVLCFIQLGRTAQLLHPIQKNFSKAEFMSFEQALFIGSLTLSDDVLYHHLPSATDLQLRSEGTRNESESATPAPLEQEVIQVHREEMLAEPNGARAGRPSHRLTGQLLMTTSQVHKVLEIQTRWEGLSPRQRRDNVTNEDFYPFLTLNRDETAGCLGVCATWLKDAIRAQGMSTWPGRPLRRSGAKLQNNKEMLESARARLRYTAIDHPDRKKFDFEVQKLIQRIGDIVKSRVEIVQENVSEKYFKRFMDERGDCYLNPDWDSLPPLPL